MNRVKALNGFQLDDNYSLDNQIYTERAINRHALVREFDAALGFEAQARSSQFDNHAIAVNRLQQPRAKFLMHLDSATNDFFCVIIDLCGCRKHTASNAGPGPEQLIGIFGGYRNELEDCLLQRTERLNFLLASYPPVKDLNSSTQELRPLLH